MATTISGNTTIAGQSSVNVPGIVLDSLEFYSDFGSPLSYDTGTNTITNALDRSFSATVNGSITNNVDSITFSGAANAYFDFGSNPIFTGPGDFTIEAWLDVDTHSTYGIAFTVGDDASNQSAYLGYCANAQQGSANTIGGGLYGDNYGSGISTGTGWHHVVFVHDNTASEGYLYVDGVLTTQGGCSPNIVANSVRFGSDEAGTYDYNGKVGKTRVYSKALSLTELQQNFEAERDYYGI